MLPREKFYWSKADDVGAPIVARHMSCNRFQALKRNIHIANNKAFLAGG
jgi:hypothetical protein